ncbi:MAG: alanine--tRNA ligase [bacterium]
MTSQQIRKMYLDFFKSKSHAIIPSASLIPENDPTVLFTTAGMHPLVPFLMGEAHPAGTRLTNVQKCVRTGDIDEVGDLSHLTFFEMLGNWSLGDYFKKEAIEWAWEFVSSKKYLGLDANKMSVTVFGGDERYKNLKPDLESIEIWKQLGVPEEKIAQIGAGVLEREDNWWGPAGATGPCGPSTEIYYWRGYSNLPPKESNVANDSNNWLEIWNIVLMEFNKTIENAYEPLSQKNIDTGMGLERTLKVLNNFGDVYQIDTLWPLIKKIEEISGKEYIENFATTKAMRIIVDHIRSVAFIIGDNQGISPGNVDQGYIVRRLIRRAIRSAHSIGIKEDFCSEIAKKVIEIFKDVYFEMSKNSDRIINEIAIEENKFRNTIEKGIKQLQSELELVQDKKELSGLKAFDLYQSYGFPLEMTVEMANEKGIKVNKKEFEEEMEKHQNLSRLGANEKFKGGLADESEISKKYHTATHLLHATLRKVLGNHVEQRGSNINAQRLRFDFSHPEKMTEDQKKEVEDLVNAVIKHDYVVSQKEMTIEEAKDKNAIGLFDEKYSNRVKVYSIGNEDADPVAEVGSLAFSREICGGPHVKKTGLLGKFEIVKEKASSAGVRRIKAILK